MLTTPGNRRQRTARPTSLFALEAQKHLAAGRPKQAVEVCKIGLVYYPEHVTGYIVLAKAFLALGKTAQALNVLRDGYRRTGVEQIEALRAEISGEVPARERGRSIDRTPAQTLRRARERELPLLEQTDEPETTEPELPQPEPEQEPEPHRPPARVPVEPPVEEPDQPEPPVEEPSVPALPVEEPDQPGVPVEEPPAAPDPIEEPGDPPVDPIQARSSHDEAAPTEFPLDDPQQLIEEATETEELEEDLPKPENVDIVADVNVEETLNGNITTSESDATEPADTVPAAAESSIDSMANVDFPLPDMVEAEIVEEPEPEMTPEPVAGETAEVAPTAVEIQIEADTVEILVEAEPVVLAVIDIEMETDRNSADDRIPAALNLVSIIDAPEPQDELVDEEDFDELIDLLELTINSGERNVIVTEPSPADEEPATSIEMREALDDTLPTFEAADTIPTLKAPALRVQEPMQTERDAAPERGRGLSLAIHSRMNVTRLRSSNLRLIPGLEFAPLRHEDQQRRQSIAPLIDETVPLLDLPDRLSRAGDVPPLPTFGIYTPPPVEVEEVLEEMVEEEIPAMPVTTFSIEDPPPIPKSFHNRPELREGEMLTPLEELARRLEKARIPVVEEPEPRHAFEPSIVSDTFASILVAQGAYAEALKAYQTLARTKPERYEFYQQQIQEMQERILHKEREADDDSELE